MGLDMSIRKIAFAAVVAAVYAALTMALAPLSYGPVQFRISEVLCILPFFFPFTTWGLFVGCVIANLLSAYGALDIIFGSLATLAAAVCTMAVGHMDRQKTVSKVLACLPPVIFNGVIVGALIAYYQTTTSSGSFLAGISREQPLGRLRGARCALCPWASGASSAAEILVF